MKGQTLAPLGGVSLDFVNMRGVLELNEVNGINTNINNASSNTKRCRPILSSNLLNTPDQKNF